MPSSKRPYRNQDNHWAGFSELKKTLAPLVKDDEKISKLLEKIKGWTKGEPFLTQLLGGYVVEYAEKAGQETTVSIVDDIVETRIVKNWEEKAACDHLQNICEPIISYGVRDSLLILYIQILQRGSVDLGRSPEQEVLLSSGLVIAENDRLKVANDIYAKVFDLAWVEALLPGITRPVSIISTSASDKAKRSRQLISSSIGGLFLGLTLLAGAIYWGLSSRQSRVVIVDSTPSAIASEEISENAIAPPEAGQEMTQLTLLGDTFSGYSTFRNADFQSVLKESGIEINYDNEFDQTLRAERLKSGEADLIVTTLDQFLQQQPKGKIVGLLDRTVGADAVVLNTKRYPGLKSLLDVEEEIQKAQQKGETLSITYATNTPSEYLAMVLDAQFDAFELSDFELMPTADASEAWDLLQNSTSNVAIAVLWEPYVTQAQQQGYSVVLSSGDVPNTIVDVIVASDELIASNPGVVSRFLENYYRRIDANARDATQLQKQVAEDGLLSVNDAVAIIKGINFFTAIESRDWMNSSLLAQRIKSTAAVLALSNRLKPDELAKITANADSLYTSQFVIEAANNSQTLIDLIRADNPALADKLAGSDAVSVPDVSAAQIQQASNIGNLNVRGQVDFTVGAAQLTDESKQTLNQLASELKDFDEENLAVRVIGHTSRSGDADANQRLSEERARVVANHLKGMGVSMNVLPEGEGFNSPLPNVDPADARNQRTEIRLVRVN